jgi:PAS domain S-box-containing protein
MPGSWLLFSSESAQAIREMVPVLIADMETGEILEASLFLEGMFGYFVRGELSGRNVDDLIPERLRAAHVEYRAQYAREPKRRSGRAIVGLRKDGTEIPIVVGLYPRMISGRPCVIVVILDTPKAGDLQHSMAQEAPNKDDH